MGCCPRPTSRPRKRHDSGYQPPPPPPPPPPPEPPPPPPPEKPEDDDFGAGSELWNEPATGATGAQAGFGADFDASGEAVKLAPELASLILRSYAGVDPVNESIEE